MTATSPTYRLSARTSGTVVFGLQIGQLALLAAGGLAAVLISVRTASLTGLVIATTTGACAAALAFIPWRGRPAFEAVPTIVTYTVRRARGTHRWIAPIPLTAPGEHARSRGVPPCLSGLDIITAPARDDGAPVAYVHDRTAHTLTAVIPVRGSEFALLDADDQHQRIAAWGRILSQFARDATRIRRISWYEHAHSGTINAPVDGDGSEAGASYAELLRDCAPTIASHELHLAVTVDASGDPNAQPADADLDIVVRSLTSRLRDAGLDPAPPLAPAALFDLLRSRIDPYRAPRAVRSLAAHRGYAEATDALPLAIEAQWDAVRIDGAWHRSYWISAWPTLDVGPRWLEPMLLDGTTTRTLALIMEPIAVTRSRRRLNVDAVRIQGDVANRERHGLRVPFHLTRAQEDLDRRERELQSGYTEYRYLALLTVTGATREHLEDASRALIDASLQCGLELRALDLRHDSAWACTLPIGCAPARGISDGLT